jgi:hypothetical protein
MTQEAAAIIMLALMVLALGLAGWGWFNRRSRYTELEASLILEIPDSPVFYEVDGLYVATTVADKPLERVAIGPLSYRAKTTLALTKEGLVVRPQGERPVLLTGADGLRAGVATWTIDRAVEPEGLTFVRWDINGFPLESYFRIVETDRTALVKKINEREVLLSEEG